MTKQLLPLLLLSACGSPEPANCGAAENIDAWQVRTNRLISSTAFPEDRCGRRTEVVSELLPGGEIAISRSVKTTGYMRPYVEIDSGAETTCAEITLNLDTFVYSGTVATFNAKRELPSAGIQAKAQTRCKVRLRPMIAVGER